MTRFTDALDAANFRPLNGKTDPFDLLSSVHGNVTDAQTALTDAGVLGWEPELIPLSGMDSHGNVYVSPSNNSGIVVPQYPGGPAYFGQASSGYKFITVEEVQPLIDAIVSHGNPLTGIIPGPVTRFVFDSKLIDIAPYSQAAHDNLGEIIRFRWQLDLANTGKASLKIGQHGLRLFCANGCTTAETMGNISISHSSLAPARIDAVVKRIMEQGALGLDEWVADARRTINAKLTKTRALEMWAELFEWGKGRENNELTGQQETQRSTLVQLWGSDTQTVTFPDTTWAWFNATTEYLDHNARVNVANGSTRERALARRVVEGSPVVESIKNAAWGMALAAA